MSSSRVVLILVFLAFCGTVRGGWEVEATRSNEDKREVRLHRDGKMTRKMTPPANQTMTILGGMAELENSWLVVVQGDKPGIE